MRKVLSNKQLFCFDYDGKPFEEIPSELSVQENGNETTRTYLTEDGLKITNIIKKYDDSYEWVSWFENTAASPSKVISRLWDTNVSLPLPYEAPSGRASYLPDIDACTTVRAPSGSSWKFDEFCAFPERIYNGRYDGQITPGETKSYSTSGGRSSEKNAPFFNVHKAGKGYIFAIGWTGQWCFEISRTETDAVVKAQIEGTEFYLLPGEKIRTSSFVVMPYEGSVTDGHNKWRRLLKKHFSLIGRPGTENCPLCANIWGGMTSESMLNRIDVIRNNKLPFDYIWIDAGWYGIHTKPNPDEFNEDWVYTTGDWRVSPHIHPDGLQDVAEAVHKAGKKLLLWFEPERVIGGTWIHQQHPEYCLSTQYSGEWYLFDLGNPDAWNYCYGYISDMLRKLGIDAFRQDFNMDILPYRQYQDGENRKGITEIKYIMGLYRLWDKLLEEFPGLLIDNCASGGRRIDIETLRRSVPLWRSDYQCSANYPSEASQCHTLSYGSWMPYSGTSCGRIYDTYRFRSAYSPALATGFTFNEQEAFGDEPEKLQWLTKMLKEYKRVQPYMSEDMYPLTQISDRKDVWCGWQCSRPEENDGIVMLFRREDAPYHSAVFALHGIDENSSYIFEDADNGSRITVSGEQLKTEGFSVTISHKRTAKLWYYQKNNV